MAAAAWTAQLHIADGAASEDAPEIAYATRPDPQGGGGDLYILAEPERPGSEPFIGDLVSAIGEDFLAGEGSLTGIVQRAIQDRHAELRDWNRASLPHDQASYGLSCLLVHGRDLFLAQIGPSLAYYRQGDRLLRRRPASAPAREPLGRADIAQPEFSQLELGPGDWALLISSAAANAIGEEGLAALLRLAPDDVLPALYPMLQALPRLSALVVAAPAAVTTPALLAAAPLAPPAATPPAAAPTAPPAATPAEAYPERASLGEALGAAGARLRHALQGLLDLARRGSKRAGLPPQQCSAGAGAGAGSDEPPADDPDEPADPPADPPAPPRAEAAASPAEEAEEAPDAERGTALIAAPPAASPPAEGGWPGNPFTSAPPPLLAAAINIDAARLFRPLIGLRAYRPRLRARALPAPAGEASAGGWGWSRSWGGLALGLGAMLLILAVVAGVLLVPELLEDSERNRFEQRLEEARRGLTAAALSNDPAASRAELDLARAAVEEALALRPLDDAGLALQQEVAATLLQANAIIQPADLALVLDFSERVAPPLALATVQIGGDTAYLLDESGGRIFALALAGGEPATIYRAGERYPLLFQFRGPEAAAPLAMQWSSDERGVSLTILDANRWLFRYTPAAGVEALELPEAATLGSTDALAVHDGELYLLDVAGGSIWRYPFLSDGSLGTASAAIRRTELTAAASLLVAEAIFVAGADGRIRRFENGLEQPFSLLELDRSLLVPASLAVGQLSGLIYAVDRGNNRVLILTPAGELLAQLRDDLLVGVRGVVPDEANGRLYYVTVDALLTSALPEIPPR